MKTIKKIAIKITSITQGKRVIKYLIKLGGKNEPKYRGTTRNQFYYINNKNEIDFQCDIPKGYTEIKLKTITTKK
jgi:hypothetical protein